MDQKSELTTDMMAAIDACRHDSDDRELPEVASVLAGAPSEGVADYHRAIEKIDRAVVGAIQEVPVPGGLAERILAGVYAQSSTPTDVCGQGDQELLVRPIARQHKLWRPSRRLVVAGVGLAMAASVVLAILFWGMRQRLDADDLLAQAKAFYANDDHSAPLSNDAPRSAPPVASGAVVGWRSVTFLLRAGTAFELSGGLSGRRSVEGTLYVIPLGSFRGPVLPDLPSNPLPQGTSAMTLAVWTDGRDVYVMIVKGDQKAFESFFVQKFA